VRAVPIPLLDPPQELEPHQRIALGVLRQALIDARSYPIRSGRALIAGWLTSRTNQECRWWCHVAGLDHSLFVSHVRRALGA
jgi:hypothetical protein